MNSHSAYADFTQRFKLLIEKNPQLILVTLSNVFTARLIGNKTHGDLAEIAVAEFINQYMYDFRSVHVGKDLFRAKQSEEDIVIINEISKAEFSVSLKAYGDGPLQLSTDKNAAMFPMLQSYGPLIEDEPLILKILSDPAFENFANVNVLPLIYDEKKQKCNIMVFDYERAKNEVAKIVLLSEGKGRQHPVYRFFDADGVFICEVRYGGKRANALQRGLWTHTRSAVRYFDSLTGGWLNYTPNPILVRLFSHALLSTSQGHEAALELLMKDIEAQKLAAKTA